MFKKKVALKSRIRVFAAPARYASSAVFALTGDREPYILLNASTSGVVSTHVTDVVPEGRLGLLNLASAPVAV